MIESLYKSSSIMCSSLAFQSPLRQQWRFSERHLPKDLLSTRLREILDLPSRKSNMLLEVDSDLSGRKMHGMSATDSLEITGSCYSSHKMNVFSHCKFQKLSQEESGLSMKSRMKLPRWELPCKEAISHSRKLRASKGDTNRSENRRNHYSLE